jgi:hypothetical protein
MLIGGPELNLGRGMRGPNRCDLVSQVFF